MRGMLLIVTLLLTLGCPGERADSHPPDAEGRARDSVIGASRLPGATGVRGALRASDSAVSRRAQEDSVHAEPR